MVPRSHWVTRQTSYDNNIKNSFRSPITIAFKAGTGGITDTHYLHNRQERGYKFTFIVDLPSSIANAHKSATNLERIKQIMKPSISELATLFNVSRQTIYNWQSGEEPSIDNMKKIEELAKTSDFLATKGLTSSQFFKRKLIENHSLFDIVRTGGSSYEAAQVLVNILRAETEQRRLLDQRLAGRKPKPKNYNDYGTPMLD